MHPFISGGTRVSDNLSRKSALINLLALPIGVAAVASATSIASAAPSLDPKAVGYVAKSKFKGKECGNCALYVGKKGAKVGACTQVKGKIAAAGYCNIYAPKAK